MAKKEIFITHCPIHKDVVVTIIKHKSGAYSGSGCWKCQQAQI